MNEHSNGRPVLDELDGDLRRAVEEMRKRPVPLPALQRALATARRLDPPATRAMWRGARKRMLAVAGFAAAILVCCWFFDLEAGSRQRLAMSDEHIDVTGELSLEWQERGEHWNNAKRLKYLRDGETNSIALRIADRDGEVNVHGGSHLDDHKWRKEGTGGMGVEMPTTPTGRRHTRLGGGFTLGSGEAQPARVGQVIIVGNEVSGPNVTQSSVPTPTGSPSSTDFTRKAKLDLIGKPLPTANTPNPVNPAPAPLPTSRPAADSSPSSASEAKPDPRFAPKITSGVFAPEKTADPSAPRLQTIQSLGQNSSPGKVDEKRIRDLTENWGKLPERERVKALEEVTKGLSDTQKKELEQSIKRLPQGGTTLSKTEDEAEVAKLAKLKERLVDKETKSAPVVRSQRLVERLEEIEGLLYERDSKGKSSEELRRKVADLGKDLAPEQRKLVDEYLKALESQATKKAPKVWHRDRQRPSFARVYVGDGNALELVSLHVTVTVEGPRARTFVDHIFRNPHNRQLEGTFEYPLPSGASAGYYAMFIGQTRDRLPPRFAARNGAQTLPADALARLTPAEIVRRVNTDDWGNLQEARIVSRQRALETYEDIVRGQVDPALLEYAGGNTFTGRVFPIPAHGYNRVLIAYEELLPVAEERVQYRLALPDCKLNELQLSLNATASDCREATFRAPGDRQAVGLGDEQRLHVTRTWKEKGPGGDAIFAFTPPWPDVQVISGRLGESGPIHFYARLRPTLKVEKSRPFAEHAVFLLDTSLSEHPDRFDINMKLLRKILESDSTIKRFNILSFDVAARWLEPKGWLENTAAARKQAFERLDGIVLEGATNISAALDELARLSNHQQGDQGADAPRSPSIDAFLLSDGQVTWGEAEIPALVARFESRCKLPVRFHCYRTGIGADNLELFETLTRRGGGIFNCYGEADLPAVAVAHRHQCFQVERVSLVDGPETTDFLVAGRRSAIYPGGELIVAGRAGDTGKATLLVEGAFLGEKQTIKFPIDIDGVGELAPRGWAEIAIASLLSLNDPALDSLITAYCQQYGVGSKVASFLILENDNEYKRLNLEAERGRTVPGGDLGKFLDEAWKRLAQAIGPKAMYARFLLQVNQARQPQAQIRESEFGGRLFQHLLKLTNDDDFNLPDDASSIGMVYQKDVPLTYLAARSSDRRDINVYVTEARRRANGRDAGGAVRVLSSIIEEYPARADALRLVGYRLLDLKQASQAARLFRQVQTARPFEPHSYRDLARSLEETGNFALAGLQYELILAGSWHNRFRTSFQQVAREEYVRMMRLALKQKDLRSDLVEFFGNRVEELSVRTQADLRVTISWNTDATDVDLWVIEPDGTKCYYGHRHTKSGGDLSEDLTQGFGPERYQMAKAAPGVYTVIVHYCNINRNLLAGESHVNVVVTRHADTPEEQSKRYNVILKKQGEQVEVCKVTFE